MGSLYSLSPVYMNCKHTARKPAHQKIHEGLSMVKADGCDPCVCACVCMFIYVWVSFCAWACSLSGMGVRTSMMMQIAHLLSMFVYLCL